MWEDKRVRQINMWERIFLKVRHNKQPGKKSCWCFITPEKGMTNTFRNTTAFCCMCKPRLRIQPVSPCWQQCLTDGSDGLGVVAQPLLLVVGLWQPFSHEMLDGV